MVPKYVWHKLDILGNYRYSTPSSPAFSVIRQARRGGGGGRGWEARMRKIKVNINQLKRNLAWVIMAIKAFLLHNLILVALLVLEIRRHKICLGIREQIIKFGYLSPENEFNLQNEFLCSKSFFSTQNWPPCQFQQFPSRGKFFHFVNFWDISMRKEQTTRGQLRFVQHRVTRLVEITFLDVNRLTKNSFLRTGVPHY